MRWIDISLPRPGDCPESERLLAEAQTLAAEIPGLQQRHGLDTQAVTGRMLSVGQLLFRSVVAADPEAFRPDESRTAARTPNGDHAEADRELGYHLIVAPEHAGLPWHWLHNGLASVLDAGAICVAEHGSRVPEVDPPRLWMQRHSHCLFEGQDQTGAERRRPEILFVAGHGQDEIRRLMFREADGIDQALGARVPARARLRIPGAVTPGLLASRAMLYQGLHFAAPTSQPPEISRAGENRWLAGLMAAAGQPGAEAVDELVGMELEVLGIDPVEVALDQATTAYARRGAATPIGAVAGRSSGLSAADWLLDDGPVLPEQLGSRGLPPLVFSNSWCSLHWLGQRFREAGSSTFVGTAIPVFSRPARLFASLFYEALGTGRCCGSAHRQAALALRERLGPDHPGWLAHGVQGYGSLRLADL
jgi:hypothetical protein